MGRGQISYGNLIQLTEHHSSRNQNPRPQVTVGTILSPGYGKITHDLLIVILPEPPLIDAKRYQAEQLRMGLGLSSEISNQSVTYAIDGSIVLTDEDWFRMGHQARLKKREFILKVRDRWINDGDNGLKILERENGTKNRYKLPETFKKTI